MAQKMLLIFLLFFGLFTLSCQKENIDSKSQEYLKEFAEAEFSAVNSELLLDALNRGLSTKIL